MNVIIHDLTDLQFQQIFPQIIGDPRIVSNKGSIRNCIGCFGCWIKTPGQCVMKDGILNELDSTCGLFDEELTVRFRESIRIDNEVRKIKGLPVAGYDDETQKAYLEYPDGRREHVGR